MPVWHGFATKEIASGTQEYHTAGEALKETRTRIDKFHGALCIEPGNPPEELCYNIDLFKVRLSSKSIMLHRALSLTIVLFVYLKNICHGFRSVNNKVEFPLEQ